MKKNFVSENGFMSEALLKREMEHKGYYGINLASTTTSGFANDNTLQGKFFIDTEITAETANKFIQDLKWYTSYQMQLAPEKRKPVSIFINSRGGSISQGFAMINAIRSCQLPTIAFIQGDCMSMAIPIALSCDHRVAYEYSTFMIHQLASFTFGKLEDMREDIEFSQMMQRRIDTFIIDNSEIDQAFLDKIRKEKRNHYFFAEEAINLGIVEDVIGSYQAYMDRIESELEEQKTKGCSCEEVTKDEGTKEEDEDGITLKVVDELSKDEFATGEPVEVTTRKSLVNKKKKLKKKINKLKKASEDAKDKENIWKELVDLEKKLAEVLSKIEDFDNA